MALEDHLAIIEADIQIDLPQCVFAFGSEHLENYGKPPRVVWVPADGTYGPANASTVNPRALRTNVRGILAHCWGSTSPAAALLANMVVAAAYRKSHSSFRAVSNHWPPRDNVTRGWLCVVLLTFDTPVLDRVAPEVILQTFTDDTTGAVAGDGILETGDT